MPCQNISSCGHLSITLSFNNKNIVQYGIESLKQKKLYKFGFL